MKYMCPYCQETLNEGLSCSQCKAEFKIQPRLAEYYDKYDVGKYAWINKDLIPKRVKILEHDETTTEFRVKVEGDVWIEGNYNIFDSKEEAIDMSLFVLKGWIEGIESLLKNEKGYVEEAQIELNKWRERLKARKDHIKQRKESLKEYKEQRKKLEEMKGELKND